jgi:hypothetical protein
MSVTASLAASLEAAGESLRRVLVASLLDLDAKHPESVAIGAKSASRCDWAAGLRRPPMDTHRGASICSSRDQSVRTTRRPAPD